MFDFSFYELQKLQKGSFNMKKWIFIFFIALAIVGCGALVSVGDHNTNSYTHNKNLNYKKDEK